jgi:hypothetical protein
MCLAEKTARAAEGGGVILKILIILFMFLDLYVVLLLNNFNVEYIVYANLVIPNYYENCQYNFCCV